MNFLNSYLTLNLLLAVLYFVFRALKIRPTVKLSLQYTSLALTFGLILAQPFFPGPRLTNSTIKVWSEPTENSVITPTMVSVAESARAEVPKNLPEASGLIFITILGLVLVFVLREIHLLRAIKQTAFPIRKIGKV